MKSSILHLHKMHLHRSVRWKIKHVEEASMGSIVLAATCMSTSGIYYPNGSVAVQYREEKVSEFTEAAAKESQIMSSFAVKSFRLFRRLQQRVSDCFGVWSSSQFLLLSALAV
jgi:hypothetical protein